MNSLTRLFPVFLLPAMVVGMAAIDSPRSAIAQDGLLKHFPKTANALTLIDVDGLLQTDLAKNEAWGDKSDPRHAARPVDLPTVAKRVAIAAQLNTDDDLARIWELAVMDLRKRYKELFEKKHGVKLGFMGFFTRAVCHALKEVPAVNAEIDGTDIVYKNFCHVGVAVGTAKGLVVPVVRNADDMSIAEVEKDIGRLGGLARDGQLSMADMQGGTFTISNGGVYGSLMSTPILNSPQSGILGMHKIQERPMAVNGEVRIRPMMYLALSYDHRIVDGKEAVTFLVRVKDSLEDPERLVLDL